MRIPSECIEICIEYFAPTDIPLARDLVSRSSSFETAIIRTRNRHTNHYTATLRGLMTAPEDLVV